MRQRRLLPLLLLLVLAAIGLPDRALALGAVTTVTLQADIQSDGSVLVTERRVIPDPRQVEFLEFLVPEGGAIELTGVADGKGPLERVTQTNTSARGYLVEQGAQVLYVEWADPAPAAPQTITFTYKLNGALVFHKDAVEWYWPAITGSGGRAVSSLTATVTLPKAGPAVLYAYGGKAGGVRITNAPFQVSAARIDAEDTFEWRLVADRSMLANASGRTGGSDYASLQQTEEARIAAQMSKAGKLWVAHWLLAMAPVLLLAVYWFTVRRFAADPDPGSLMPEQLMAVSPAVVGWVYDSSWFDFASAQLMHLERRGDIAWEPDGYYGDIKVSRVPGRILSEADEALLQLYRIRHEPQWVSKIAEDWVRDQQALARDRTAWLKAVEAEVPPEWLYNPSLLVAGIPAAIYLVAGVFSGGVGEWLALWAVAVLLGLMAWKRKWLSPLGESYTARWVSTYFAATLPGRRSELPQVDPEYLLAVEVGDEHLERAMGTERYKVVKVLYQHLE